MSKPQTSLSEKDTSLQNKISKVKEETVNTDDNEECLPGHDSHH